MEYQKMFMNSTNVVVLFRKNYRPELNRVILKPYKVVTGIYYEEECMFVDTKGNSYHHILESLPGKSFGLRASLLDLKKKYKTKDLKTIKQKYLKEALKYKYYDLSTNEVLILVKEHNKTQELTEFEDMDKQSILAYIIAKQEGAIYELTEEDEELSLNKENPSKKEEPLNLNFNTHKLAKEVKKKVISQDDAIEKIITTIWTNTRNKGVHHNILVIGNTGVGKTEIFRSISKKLNLPFYQTSIADVTKSGYRGRSVSDILKDLILSCDKNIKKAENAIVFLDEFDKKAIEKETSGVNLNESVQEELLTILEDGVVTINIGSDYLPEFVTLNTKNITFIGAGAFDGILELREEKNIGFGARNTEKLSTHKEVKNEDIVKYGFKPEIVGRFQTIATLNNLTKQDLITIMKKSENNILENQIRLINSSGVEVHINEEVIELIAEKAIKRKTGARGLDSAISDLFSKAIYEISNPENKCNYLEITKETVIDPNKYILKTIQKPKVLTKQK